MCNMVSYLEDGQLGFSKQTFMKYLLFLDTQFGVFFLQRELCGCRHQEANNRTASTEVGRCVVMRTIAQNEQQRKCKP